MLFEDIVLFDGDERTDTVVISESEDALYFADTLSDGLDWWLYDKIEFAFGSQSRFDLESLRLDFVDPEYEGPDLVGYSIESVTRTIMVDLDSPGDDPAGDGNWTDFLVTGIFEIYGHPIPEPTILLPLLLAALIIRRRKSRPCAQLN